MLGGSWLSGCYHPVVQVGFVDDLRRMSYHFPDPAEDHRLLRVVLPDLLALLTQLLSHGSNLRGEVRVLRLYLLELLPVRSLCQLSEDVSESAIVQGLVGSPGDVLQPGVLVLQLLQPFMDPLEGIIWKIPSGEIHVPPRGLLALSGFRMRGRRRRRRVRGSWSSEGRRASG